MPASKPPIQVKNRVIALMLLSLVFMWQPKMQEHLPDDDFFLDAADV